jgi:spore germination protein KB
MDKEVISGRQLIPLIFTMIIATATLGMPSFVTQNAGRDGWISVFVSGFVGVIVVLIVVPIGLKYPECTPIEYSEIILGKWMGKLVSLIFLFFYLHITAIIVREVASTINYNLMMDTDIEVITIVLFLISAYGVKMGFEVLTRVNLIILMVTFIAMFISLALLLKEMNLELLSPILAKGIKPVLRDSITPSGWFAEVVTIAFLIPFINKKEEVRSSAIIGIVWVTVTLAFFVALTISVFGDALVSNLNFPILKAVRIINVADYIQNIEEIFLIPWLLSNVVKICIFYYVAVLIIARFFKLENVKTFVFPVGLLIFGASLVLFNDNLDLLEFLRKVWGVYSIPIQLGIPLILLTVDKIRSGWNG